MPSQENEKAMDGLLRRSLARDSASNNPCPDAEHLAAYYDQSLGPDEATPYELHFSTCSRCRRQLAAMARAAEQAPDFVLDHAEVRAPAMKMVVSGEARASVAQLPSRTITSDNTAQERKPRRKFADTRWLIPVAAILILGTVSLLHFGSRMTNRGSNTEVAISRSSAPPQDQIASEAQKKIDSLELQKNAAPEAAGETAPAPKAKTTPNNKSKSASLPPTSPTHSATAPPAASSGATATGGGIASGRIRTDGGWSYVPRPGARAGIVGARKKPGGARFASPHGNSIPSNPDGQPVEVTGAIPTAETQGAAADVAQNASRAESAEPAEQNPAPEPAPAAPAPELSVATTKAAISADSAEAVKSPTPPPPASSEEKSTTTESAANARTIHGAMARSLNGIGARKRSSAIVVYTADPNVIYRVATSGGLVEISSDGGKTWQGQLLDPPADINGHSAVAPKICWLVGSSGAVFVTEDGKAWLKLPPPTSKTLVDVEAKDAYRATVTSDDGQRWTTDDAGDIWYPAK